MIEQMGEVLLGAAQERIPEKSGGILERETFHNILESW